MLIIISHSGTFFVTFPMTFLIVFPIMLPMGIVAIKKCGNAPHFYDL